MDHPSDGPGSESSELSGIIRLAITAAFAVFCVACGAGFLISDVALREIGLLGVLFLGVGTAPLQLLSGPRPWTRLGTGVLFGFTIICGIGALMIYIPGAWHPLVVAIYVVALSAIVHAVSTARVLATATRRAAVRGRLADLARSVRWSWSLTLSASGTAVCIGAAIQTGHLDAVVDGGILTSIDPLWFVGLGLLALAVGTADRRTGWEIGIAVFAIALVLTITPGIVYSSPRSQSAAKHAGLVLQILDNHHIIRSQGIYPAYSGFFAAIAWICSLTRVHDPLFGLAAYWPVVIGLTVVVEYRWLFRRLVRSDYATWLGVGLAVLVNSIGQDYFSPQSVGFVMAVAAFALALPPQRAVNRDTHVERVLLICAGLAMAPEHELSPFIVGGILLLTLVWTRGRPWWACLAFLVPAIAWAVLNHGVLGGNLSIADAFNLANFEPPTQASAPGLSPAINDVLSSDGLVLSMVIVAGLGVNGFVRNRRQRWSWMYAMAASVGLAIVLVNPYGNEGIFRAALFAIPFLTMLGLRGAEPRARRHASVAAAADGADLGAADVSEHRPSAGPVPTMRRRILAVVVRSRLSLALVTAALITIFICSSFSMDQSSVIQPADYAAVQYFEANSPLNSQLLLVPAGDEAVDIPYGSDNRGEIDWETIDRQPWLRHGHPTAADLVQVERLMQKQAPTVGPDQFYALWSTVLAQFSRAYGLETLAQSRRWLSLMEHSGRWHVVFRRGGAVLLQYAPKPS